MNGFFKMLLIEGRYIEKYMIFEGFYTRFNLFLCEIIIISYKIIRYDSKKSFILQLKLLYALCKARKFRNNIFIYDGTTRRCF